MERNGTAGLARRLTGWTLRAGVAAAILGGVALGVMALNERAGAGIAAAPAAPLPVLAAPLVAERGYSEVRRYAGRLEPARRTALGFERGGRVVAVLVAEGDTVAAGAPVARLDTALLEAERAEARAVRARLATDVELARLTRDRQEALSAAAASAQRRDEARLALAAAEAALAEADARLAAITIELEKSELRAPFAGRIAARRADEGAMLAAGAPVVEVLETGRPRARIGIAPEVAAGLVPGAEYALEIDGRERPARLAALRPDLDPASRTVTALFDLDGGGGVPFGATAVFAAETFHAAEGAWLPLSALVDGGRGTWVVYTLAEDGDAERIAREAVEVLSVQGDRAYVRGALPEGVRVVRDGTHRVRPGQAVAALAGE
jgi:RND family efflux transporter MFP subunit